MKKWVIGIIVVLVAAGAVFWNTLDKDMRTLLLNMPTDKEVLFWSTSQRDATFRALDRIPFLSKSRPIKAGQNAYPLPAGEPLPGGLDIDAFMKDQRTAALVIIQDGKVRLEKYGLGFGPEGRWTSFSVAKSLTSTLAGAAVKDGYIKSVNDKVSDYIPDLKGSVYDDVTVEQLLTMTSGVKWNEIMATRNRCRMSTLTNRTGMDVTVSYMRKTERGSSCRTKWFYKTGETNLWVAGEFRHQKKAG